MGPIPRVPPVELSWFPSETKHSLALSGVPWDLGPLLLSQNKPHTQYYSLSYFGFSSQTPELQPGPAAWTVTKSTFRGLCIVVT
jgi:hypothetical protein